MATPSQQPNSAALAKRPVDEIRNVLDHKKYRDQLATALIGSTISPDKLIRVAITAIQGDGKLQKCDAISIAGSLIQLAQVGLTPDGFQGHAYLVPFFNKKKNRLEAKPIIGYRGYVELAYRSDKVTRFDARVVYEGDVFECDLGSGLPPIHRPNMDPKKRGEIIASYAVVKLATGEHLVELMLRDDIERVRARSQAGDSGPWETDWSEMARKTPARRISKWVPSPASQLAAAMEEAGEAGKTETVMDAVTGEIIVQRLDEASEETVNMPARLTAQPVDAASKPAVERETEKKEPVSPEFQPQEEPQGEPGVFDPAHKQISDGKRKKLFAVARARWGPEKYEEELHAWLKTKKVDSVRHIKPEQVDSLIDSLGEAFKLK